MVALLGLLAVAGFQNRGRISQLMQPDQDNSLNGMQPSGVPHQQSTDGIGGIVGNLRSMFTGNGGIAGGLSELLGRFTNPVQSAKANSWVNTGPNGDLTPDDLNDVLDDETVSDLMEKTGLSRAELMSRLSAVLPDAVDQLTPNGRLPSADEARAAY